MSASNMRGDLVLEDITSGQRFVLSSNETSYKCGRGRANHITTTSILSSREHCMFIRANSGLNVLDLGSSNGIYINGVHQQSKVMATLKINDLIGIGCNNTTPDTSNTAVGARPSQNYCVFRLLLLEEKTEPEENVGDATQQPVDVTTKIKTESKRRQSRDSLDLEVPCKVPKLETRPSIPDIIDISDESSDEIVAPKGTEEKSYNDKNIVGESKVTGAKAKASEIAATSRTKEISRALQENSSEISFTTGSSTYLSTRGRNKSDDNDRNSSNSSAAGSSVNSSGSGRKKSETSDKELDISNPKNVTNSCNSPRGAKVSEDIDKSHCSKPTKSRRIDEPQPPATAKETSTAKPASSRDKPAQTELIKCKKKVSPNPPPKKLNSSIDSKASPSKKKVAPVRSKTKNSPGIAEHSSNLKAKEANEHTTSRKVVDFLVPPLDLEELNLQERMECEDLRRAGQLFKYEPELQITDENGPTNEKLNATNFTGVAVSNPTKLNPDMLREDRPRDPKMPLANSSTVQPVNNCDAEQLIKYEPELHITDEEEPIAAKLTSIDSASIALPTPIKLKRVKQEPKTRYSEFDVVVLSDDEDGVFPASQLFGDDDEVEKVQIKCEIEDEDRDMFEDRRNEITDTIVLSDSDDEDNPWYDRLLRSQLLNESRQSLSSSIKEEERAEKEKEIVAPLEDDDLFDMPDRGEAEGALGLEAEELLGAEEEENRLVAEEEEKLLDAEDNEERLGAEDQEDPLGAVEQEEPLGAEEESDVSKEAGNSLNDFHEFSLQDVADEIFDIVFANKENVTEKVDLDKPSSKGKKNRTNIIEKEKDIDEAVCKSPREKQSCRGSGATDKKTKSEKMHENKIHKKTSPEERSTDEKRASDQKKPAKKKRLSEDKKSTEDKRLSTDKRLSDGKKTTEDKHLSTDKQLSEEKKSTENKGLSTDKRSFEEKIPPVGKRKRLSRDKSPPIEKPSLPKRKSLDREKSSVEDEKTVAKDPTQKPKKKKLDEEKRQRSSEAKSSSISESSIEKPEVAEPKSKTPETPTNARTNAKPNPLVVLTKIDTTTKTLQLVDPPFLTNGAHRGVSCRVTTTDKLSDKQDSPVASTSGVVNGEKSPARKLTTKEKKELKQKSRSEVKMQLKEQRHRRIKNKWAAECLPASKKPATPSCSSKERKDRALDRKEKLRQIAIEKKLAAEKESSPVKRIAVKAKAKVTTNSRNDFLVKELEEQAKLTAANAARMLAESGDDSEVATGRDKNAGTETLANGETSLVRGEKSGKDAGTETLVNGETSLGRGEKSGKDAGSEGLVNGGTSLVRGEKSGKDAGTEALANGETSLVRGEKSKKIVETEALVNGETSLVLGEKFRKTAETEALVNGEPTLVRGENSPGRKAAKGKDLGVKHITEVNIFANEDCPPRSKKEKDKAAEKPREIPANGESGCGSGAIPKKPSRVILIEQSEVPNMIPERPTKPNATTKLGLTKGSSHVFGEPILKLPESSNLAADPRIRFNKLGKSLLKENREPNAGAEPGRAKKRVSFNDLNTRVEIYEIDPGNSLKKCVSKDAPLQVNKFPRCRTASSKECCPKLEEFLLQIFKWNPVWLEEQKQFSNGPPVVDDKKLVPLLSKYTNYEDYYEVTSPLLALELWCGITRDYEGKMNQKGCFNFSIVNHSITLTTVPATNVRVTTLMLEVVVSKREAENQAPPVYGDLVFFEYISNRKTKEGCQRWKVFGYVTNVRQKLITPLTFFNHDLLNFVKDPHILLTYTVMTKPLDNTDIQTNKVSRLRTISYLRSNIRMIQALQNLPVSALCKTILYPKIEDYQLPIAGSLANYPLVTKDNLNPKQMEAVAKVTEAAVGRMPKVCLIQGPPGTGKTRVIVNLVTQILYGNNRYQNNKKLRILVSAPSNAAIDEIALRLLKIRGTFQKGNRFNMVRIGRDESMHPQVKEISVTELAIKDVKKTADNYMAPTFTRDSVEEEKRFLQARINALELEKANANNRQDPLILKQVIRKLGDVQAKLSLLMNRRPADRLDTKELTRLQRAAENTLLKGADVIACTLTSCYTNQMEAIFGGKDSISVCIVDEATQTSEAETLIPLMLGVRTLVLVGDTNQLPATVLSQKAKQFGLEQSLFARIQNSLDGQKNNPIILLDMQYRMSTPVAYWPNRYFYAGALKNEADNTPFPVHGYKVLNLDSTQDNDKFTNTDEASFVAQLVYTIMSRSKLDHLSGTTRIGVITPYNFQKQMVIKKIRERIAHVPEKVKKKIVHEVNTVDSFQGREREIIIMSCVRSNGIGFLSDRQRLCVALTRAKHSVILCGNFRTFERDPMWKALLRDARERKAFSNVKASADVEEIKSLVIR